jgi:hypothetical protein
MINHWLCFLATIIFISISSRALAQLKPASQSYWVSYEDTIPTPPCQQVTLATDTSHADKRMILVNFIEYALDNKYFVNDKGIVHLYRYKSQKGDSIWRLHPTIEDKYRDNPPTMFSDFHGDIVLVYDADEQGNIRQNPNPEPYNDCLEDVIGDRVYRRPKKKGRWSNYMLPNGRVLEEGAHRVAIDHGKDQTIVFDQDGSYKILPPYENP